MSEPELRARLEEEGIVGPGTAAAITSWSNGPGERYSAHRHGYDKVLVADSGSIVFTLPEEGRAVPLSRGDRLDLPAGTLHAADVGPRGVSCTEAHLPAGTLAKAVAETAAEAEA